MPFRGDVEEAKIRTNPVLYLEPQVAQIRANDDLWLRKGRRLAKKIKELSRGDVPLPRRFLRELADLGIPLDAQEREGSEKYPTGVVGLIWAPEKDLGLVTPLDVQSAPPAEYHWRVAAHLPFTQTRIEELYRRLMAAMDLEVGLPERLVFQIDDGLQCRADGRSMDVAALVATLLAQNTHIAGKEKFRGITALVEVEEKGAVLRPTRGVRAKLEAFRREYDRGALLIVHPDCEESGEFHGEFDQVWRVSSLEELGTHLQRFGLLEPLWKKVVLRLGDYQRINARLFELLEQKHSYKQAARLAERVLRCERHASVPVQEEERVRRAHLDAMRHMGDLLVVEKEAAMVARMKANGSFATYEDLMEGSIHLAASEFDRHGFERIKELLQPRLEEVQRDPRHVSPRVRYMLFNTLGRSLVALGEEGWKELFLESIEIQKYVEPAEVQRTRNYLIEGLLSAGQLEEAERFIEEGEEDALLSAISRHYLRFYRADLARRRGEVWTSLDEEELEKLTPFVQGFYFQATGRQEGRPREEQIGRLRRAQKLFKAEMHSEESILFWLAAAVGMAASAREENARWGEEREDLLRFFETRTGEEFDGYYRKVIREMPEQPDLEWVEGLLDLIPYF